MWLKYFIRLYIFDLEWYFMKRKYFKPLPPHIQRLPPAGRRRWLARQYDPKFDAPQDAQCVIIDLQAHRIARDLSSLEG